MTKILLLLGLLACGATAVNLRLRGGESDEPSAPSEQGKSEADYLQSQSYRDDLKLAEEHAGEADPDDAGEADPDEATDSEVRSLLESRSEVQLGSTERGWYCGSWWRKCKRNRRNYFAKQKREGNFWCGGHYSGRYPNGNGKWCPGCGTSAGMCNGECIWDATSSVCRDHIPCPATEPLKNCDASTPKCTGSDNQSYPCIDETLTTCPSDFVEGGGKCGHGKGVCKQGEMCSQWGWCGRTDAHTNSKAQPKYSHSGACCKIADLRDDKYHPDGKPPGHDKPWHKKCNCACIDPAYKSHTSFASSTWQEVPNGKHMVTWRVHNKNECYCARVDSDRPLYGAFRYVDTGAGWDSDYGVGQCNFCDAHLSQTHCTEFGGNNHKASSYMSWCEMHDLCLGFHDTKGRVEAGSSSMASGGHFQCGTFSHMNLKIIQAAVYARTPGGTGAKKTAGLAAAVGYHILTAGLSSAVAALAG